MVVDSTGYVLDTGVIYTTHSQTNVEKAKTFIQKLVEEIDVCRYRHDMPQKRLSDTLYGIVDLGDFIGISVQQSGLARIS